MNFFLLILLLCIQAQENNEEMRNKARKEVKDVTQAVAVDKVCLFIFCFKVLLEFWDNSFIVDFLAFLEFWDTGFLCGFFRPLNFLFY